MVVPDSYSDGDIHLLCIVSLFYFILKKTHLLPQCLCHRFSLLVSFYSRLNIHWILIEVFSIHNSIK